MKGAKKINIKLDFKAHQKQKELLSLLESEAKYVTCCAGRRFGKSILARFLCLKWALSEENQTILYVCPTHKLCNEFFRKFVKMVEKLPCFESSLAQDKIIIFKNGSEIKFFSAIAHESIRGFEAHYAILDEFAFYRNLTEAWESSIRSVVRDKGKKILFISTPMGKRGAFWDMFSLGMSNNKRYASLQASALDSPYTSKEEVEDMKITMSDRAYRQEVLAQFLDLGTGGVFKNVLQNIKGNPEITEKCYGGLDIGFTDSTVLTIVNDKGEMTHKYEWEELEYTKLIPEIKNKIKLHNVTYVNVETNSMGKVVYHYLKEGMESIIKAWVTTNETKNTLVEDLMMAFEQSNIKILDDQVLINQLDCYTAQLTRTGKQTYNGVGAKDDNVISLGLAYECYLKYRTTNTTKPSVRVKSNRRRR